MQFVVAGVVGLVVWIGLKFLSAPRPPGTAPRMLYVQPPQGQSGASLTTPVPWNVQLPSGEILTVQGTANQAPPPPPYTLPQSAPPAPGAIEARRGAGHFN